MGEKIEVQYRQPQKEEGRAWKTGCKRAKFGIFYSG